MAKNDGMDALGALVGLGVLGSILDGVTDAGCGQKNDRIRQKPHSYTGTAAEENNPGRRGKGCKGNL